MLMAVRFLAQLFAALFNFLNRYCFLSRQDNCLVELDWIYF